MITYESIKSSWLSGIISMPTKNGCILELTISALEKVLGLPEGVIYSVDSDYKTDRLSIKINTDMPKKLETDYGTIQTVPIYEFSTYPVRNLDLSKKYLKLNVVREDNSLYLKLDSKVRITIPEDLK